LQDQLEVLDHRDHKEKLDHRAILVLQVQPDQLDLKAILVQLDQLVQIVQLRDQLEVLDHRDHKEKLDHKAHREKLDHKAHREKLDHKDLKDLLVMTQLYQDQLVI
jgi:hypothetical protein